MYKIIKVTVPKYVMVHGVRITTVRKIDNFKIAVEESLKLPYHEKQLYFIEKST